MMIRFMSRARAEHGTGPSVPERRMQIVSGGQPLSFEMDTAVSRPGGVNAFTIPAADDLARQTEIVMQGNGFKEIRRSVARKPLPPVHHIILIVKGNRSFDEIFGDIERAGDREVLSEPAFARFGSDGYVSGGSRRFSLHVDITPNHHRLAARWTLADNFYADSDYSSCGHDWLRGIWPDLWSETALFYREAGNSRPSREAPAGTLWGHLAQHGVDYLDFDPPASSSVDITDLARARQFIHTIRRKYLEPGKPFPQFLLLHLPGDRTRPEDPDSGFPYAASYVASNDYALGQIVEFLSQTAWWKNMAIFVTEGGAEGGADHLDSHRVPLLGVGPWFRTGYVSHVNGSAPSLLRTIFKLLNLPPVSLYDATASDLSDMFGVVPDFAPYRVTPEDTRLIDLEKALANLAAKE